MIRNVIWDIGRVLIDFEWRPYTYSLFDKETADAVSEAMFGTGYWHELDRAVLTEDEILQLFYDAAPELRTEIRAAFDNVGKCVKRREWPISQIESLRARGYKNYFLSNYSRHVMAANPGALDFLEHMDGGVFSCDEKVIKPDPEIYRRLLTKYDLRAEECLFIDDNAANIAAARVLGFKTILFGSYEQMMADLDKALTKDATHDAITVVCYGDSNTYGYDPQTGGRYPKDARWPVVLEKLLNSESAAAKSGLRYEVISEGLNGRTTAFERPEAPWKNGYSSFVACLGTHKPVDCVVIMLGTNDCNVELGLNALDSAAGMEQLVTAAEKYSPDLQGYIPKIIVVAPGAIGSGYRESPFAQKLSEASVRHSHELGRLYKDLAAKHMCVAVDATTSIEVSPDDCEHLTERGHSQLAKLIYTAITGEEL